MSFDFADELALLPSYLGGHIQLSLPALAIGLAISFPLALASTRIKWLQWPLLTLANIFQTIPALALLALMVPLLGRIGFLPALLALVLYSMLPIIRNTVTGIQSIDRALVEAGRGLGMTENQILFKIQVPLAAPTILAGLRISAVWVVGIATLSTPVGAPSLGNYIFTGLQIQDYGAVVFGVVTAASFAILLDLSIRLQEVAAERRSVLVSIAGGVGLALLFSAPWLMGPDQQESGRTRVKIGTKSFTEQYILAEVIDQLLEDRGFFAEKVTSLGSTVVFDALRKEQIDLYVDYSGTIWANHMERRENPGRREVLHRMGAWLEEKYGIRSLGSLGFENAYALAVRRETANRLNLRSISDLVEFAPEMEIAGDYEFFSRPEWSELQESYAIRFAARRTMEPSLMYQAVAEREIDVISAFSTDGRIDAFDLVLLEDDHQALPPYDAVLLLAPGAAEKDDLNRALRPLIDSISTSRMREANRQVDLEGIAIPQVAQSLRTGLGRTRE